MNTMLTKEVYGERDVKKNNHGNFISRVGIKLDFVTHAQGVYPTISCETTKENEKLEVLFLVVFYAPRTTRTKERENQQDQIPLLKER